MSTASARRGNPHASFRFALALLGIVLGFAALRWPLLNVPMERDEGEYATLGLGMLQGIPPYLDAYTMKLPGAAALHAVIYGILGPSVRSLHLALLWVNAASIILVGLLGRRWMSQGGALFAAASYGTFTIGTGMFGLWLSAEHFAVLFLLAGAWVLPPFLGKSGIARLWAGAFLLGMAPLIKQHAAIPAGAWLATTLLLAMAQPLSKGRRARMALGAAGFFLLPLLLTMMAMAGCGVFDAFRFWTFQYAAQYVSGVSLPRGWAYFKIGAVQVFGENPLLWMMAAAGWGSLAWKARSAPSDSIRLLLTTAAAALAVSAGLMFRGQYFILLAPYAALLSGFAWQAFWARCRNRPRLRPWLGAALGISAFASLTEPLLLGMRRTPDEICRTVYGMNPFPECAAVADYLRKHTQPHEKIAVLGSEPSLYFLANRRPAFPYLCVYEMLKPHAFAREMQREAIRRIEESRPPYLVLVNIPTSWGLNPETDPTFLEWLPRFIRQNYKLEGVADLISENQTVFQWGENARSYSIQSPYSLSVFHRKD